MHRGVCTTIERMLDQVIYGNKLEDLIRKFHRRGEELTLNRTIEMIHSQEAMEQSWKDIKSQGSKLETSKSIDVISAN